MRKWKLYKPRLGEAMPPPFPAMLRVWDGPELAEGCGVEVVEIAEVENLVALRRDFEAELDQDADYIYGDAAKAFFDRFDAAFPSDERGDNPD